MTKKSRKPRDKNIPNWQPIKDMIREGAIKDMFDESIEKIKQDVESYENLEVEIQCCMSEIEAIEADLLLIRHDMDDNRFYTMDIIELCEKDNCHKCSALDDVLSYYLKALEMLKPESIKDFDEAKYQEFIDKAMINMYVVFGNQENSNVDLICRILLSQFNRLNNSVESYSIKLSEHKDMKSKLLSTQKSFEKATKDLIESAKCVASSSAEIKSIL